MNRKKASKEKAKVDAYVATLHPYDDPDNWAKGGFEKPPWTKEQIDAFQKRLDSAFGAKNAIVLVWSGDRSFGDEVYDGPWDVYGEPIGRPHRKPVLLFGEYPVGGGDSLYIYPPRWVLMEAHHGSQLEDGWEDSSYVSDPAFIGGKKRIRPKTPPEYYYVHVIDGTLSTHEGTTVTGDVPPCCVRMWKAGKRICYGDYREPDDRDIAMVGELRKAMDKDGYSQRSDSNRDTKSLLNANLSTKYFMQQAAHRQFVASKEFMIENAHSLCGDILEMKGSTMSKLEMQRIIAKAMDQEEQELFSNSPMGIKQETL